MRLPSLLYTVVFSAIVGGMGLLFLAPLPGQGEDEFQRAEQRPRAQADFQGWTSASLKGYFVSVERAVADRLPFRPALLHAQAQLSRAFGRSLNPNLVLFGKEGWLFFGNQAGRGIDQYRGLAPLDDARLRALKAYFGAMRDALAREGIPLLLVIAPDKHSIYPEYLPEALSRRGLSPLDQLASGGADLPLLDLRSALDEQKRLTDIPLYFRADSHWNEYGAYVAYRRILEQLRIPPAVEAKPEDFVRPPLSASKGDLAIRTGSAGPFLDEYTYLRRNFFTGPVSLQDLRAGTTRAWDANEMTRLSAMHSHRTEKPGLQGTLLVLGDSFTENMSRYLNNGFGSVVYQHYTEFGADDVLTLASRYRPGAVVFLMVERNLLLPTESLIPAERRGTAAAAPARAATLPADRVRDTRSVLVPNERLISESSLIREIVNARIDNGDLRFRATGFDPYFHLPPVAPMPNGAVVRLELTLPGERLVQLYYQTPERPRMMEEQSVKASLPAGRHVIEWRIAAPLDGHFRLDPGNAPGEYRIHRVELLP